MNQNKLVFTREKQTLYRCRQYLLSQSRILSQNQLSLAHISVARWQPYKKVTLVWVICLYCSKPIPPLYFQSFRERAGRILSARSIRALIFHWQGSILHKFFNPLNNSAHFHGILYWRRFAGTRDACRLLSCLAEIILLAAKSKEVYFD